MPTNLFNPGKIDEEEKIGMTVMEGFLAGQDDQHEKKQRRRVGLYILNRFDWEEAIDLFDMLDIPTKDMAHWKDALDRALMMPEPEPEVEHPPKAAPRAKPEVPKTFMDSSRPGEANGMAKATDIMVVAIRKDFDTHNYKNLKELGTRYGVSRQTVANIGRRNTWKHVPETAA